MRAKEKTEWWFKGNCSARTNLDGAVQVVPEFLATDKEKFIGGFELAGGLP